jgi:hypothetical protein
MKIRALITVGVILLSTLGCKNSSAQEKFSEEKVKEMLKNFYTSYITENSTFPVNQKKRDSIEKKYCTPYVLREYADEPSIEGDPFLRADIMHPSILKILTFRKDASRDDLYYISYKLPAEKEPRTIRLLIVKEKDSYKIDLVYKK